MMKEIRKDSFSLNEVKGNLKLFLHSLRRKFWLLVLVVLAGGALGAAYFYIQKPKYQAVSTFILEEKSGGGGGLAGLASQFGFNLGGLGGGSIFSGDNILDILKSKKVVQQVLLTRVDEANNDGKTLADLYLDFTGIKKGWKEEPLLSDISFAQAKEPMNPLQDSVLNIIYDKILKNYLITERTSKQGTIIKVQVTAPDGLFARLMTERLVGEASKLYLEIRVGTAMDNIRQLQRRSDSLLYLLNNKSYRAAASQPLDINPGIRTAVVPVEIANRDKAVVATLYAEVTKNLEASKLILSQQTPVIQLLDRPAYLLDDNKKGLGLLVVAASFLAGFAYVAGAFFFFLLFGVDGKKSKAAEI